VIATLTWIKEERGRYKSCVYIDPWKSYRKYFVVVFLSLSGKTYQYLQCHPTVFSESLRTYKLDGSNFTVWKRKITYLVTTENIDYVIDLPAPEKTRNRY
jgi:hypothetical protein